MVMFKRIVALMGNMGHAKQSFMFSLVLFPILQSLAEILLFTHLLFGWYFLLLIYYLVCNIIYLLAFSSILQLEYRHFFAIIHCYNLLHCCAHQISHIRTPAIALPAKNLFNKVRRVACCEQNATCSYSKGVGCKLLFGKFWFQFVNLYCCSLYEFVNHVGCYQSSFPFPVFV